MVVTVVALVEPIPFTTRDLGDDTVELPSDPPDRTEEPGPTPVRCSRDQVLVDCLAWDVDTRHPVSVGPRLQSRDVLVDRGPNGLVVRDAGTGQVRWARDDVDGARPVDVVAGVVLVDAGDGQVRALDVHDGADRWRVDDVVPVGRLAGLAPARVVLGRSGADGVSSLLALEPATGAVAWEWPTPWSGPIGSSVQAVGTDAVLVTGDGRLARVDAATGTTVWEVETVDRAYLQPQAPGHVSAQQLTEGDAPQLWVHDVETGEVVLRQPSTRIVGHVVVEDVLVVHAPAEGVIRAHDLSTGEQRWNRLLDGGPGALAHALDPAAPAAIVVLERDPGRVVRLVPDTGEPRWEVSLRPTSGAPGPGSFLGSPMLADGRVVVEDTSSVVTVLDLATGRELVRVEGDPNLDVRTLDPLTLVQDTRWMRVTVPSPTGDAAQ